MHGIALVLGLLVANGPGPAECANPPSRAASGYWSYIEACGCARLDPPSRASQDYERYLKACSHWRERNPQIHEVAPQGAPDPGGGSGAAECANPPSRAADGYWDYIEACGCAALDAPSSASDDHDRFMKACAQWRERNPQIVVPAAGAEPDEDASPEPTASPSPDSSHY